MAGADGFARIAARFAPAADHLVEVCAPAAGALVVDVGTGTGNVARAARRRGARVLGIDLAEDMLRAGEPANGWLAVGDARAVPVRDGAVDMVLSGFAAVYAGVPEHVLPELARVCRRGGAVGLTAWAAGGFQHQAGAALRAATGTAEEDVAAASWGDADRLRAALSRVGTEVQVLRGRLESRIGSVAAYWERAAAGAPPIVAARAALPPPAFDAFAAAFQAVVRRCGTQDAEGFTLVDEYLVGRVTVA